MLEYLGDPNSWASLLNAFGVNILLSIDNAVVIALAVRALPPRRQRTTILLAVVAIIGLRLALTLGVDLLAGLPLLKIVGALLLLWIGVKLLLPAPRDQPAPTQSSNAWAALGTVLAADAALSLDNVLGVYGAAGGSWPAICGALVASVPLVIFGSRAMLNLIGTFPIVIVVGGALIGFAAGSMALGDVSLRAWLQLHAAQGACAQLAAQTEALRGCLEHTLRLARTLAGAAGAGAVVAIGAWLARRARAAPS